VPRSAYRVFRTISTRWMDNDVYGHVNNVVYYSFFDTAVNGHLIDAGALQLESSPVIGLVIETQCNYFSSLTYPQAVDFELFNVKPPDRRLAERQTFYREPADRERANGQRTNAHKREGSGHTRKCDLRSAAR
jgi:acyl-CoA thioesterase FadM